MRFASGLFAFVLKFGGIGLLALGVLDSSFLFAPCGNDLLEVALTVQHPHLANLFYYSAMSALGSAIGCWLIDLTLRPLGAHGLDIHLSHARLRRVREKVSGNAGQVLALASLAPPPFPFTVFVMAAAALQYPRKRLLAIVAVARMVRFTLLGLLALRFGPSILRWAKNPVVQGFLVALTVFCIIGSVVSVYGWIRRSRHSPGAGRAQARRR